ncbi:MAG: DinB family protein [Chloroflexi bacterium]|nr:DinB family protein [Chloroflexota bacterium]
MDERQELLQRLDEARARVLSFLPQIESLPGREIYPGWTVKEMLAHMTGWDDAVIASLRAHLSGREPGTPAERGIDDYNARTVETREALDYPHIRREWEATRLVLKEIIQAMPDDKFTRPLVLPWGPVGTVTDLLNIFVHHEHEHAGQLEEWVKDTRQPLSGRH